MSRALRVATSMVLLLVPAEAIAGSLGSPLPLMLALRERGGAARPDWDWILPGIADDAVGVTIRFRGAPDAELLTDLAEAGVELRRDGRGALLHLGPLYSARVPWEGVLGLAARPEVGRVELARPPALQAHLDVSVPEIEATEAWARQDDLGRPLDGTGMVVADFDSGIDVFHPLFFHLDGGVFDWLDMNGDGRFEPGVDVVDLDGDGRSGPGEALALLEGALLQSGRAWLDGVYDPDVDWLYNDADGDGERSFGPDAGYTDLDPSFGELLFVSLDGNGNGRLDPDEPLVALGTSKLLATLIEPDVIRYRGVDLIETPVVDPAYESRYGRDDRSDHGTGVSSIIAGGWSGARRRITGVAPGAELILIDMNNDLGLAAALPWAISLGASVGCHPYGHFATSFLDGSSNEELAIDLAADEQGALQVVSAGNHANDRDTATAEVPPASDGPLTMPFAVTHYDWTEDQVSLAVITVCWREPAAALSFTVADPEGAEAVLGSSYGAARVGAASVDHSREDSPRGTAKFDIIVYRTSGDLLAGEWVLVIDNDVGEPVGVRATIANDRFVGGSGTRWSDDEQVDQMATVHAPATADRAVGACSYGTRQTSRGEVLGAISEFSSRGPRIDGLRLVDVCAPGDYDIIWAASSRHDRPFGAYTFGGGTSASAPHVAGAIALLRQAAPWASAAELEEALYGGALVDGYVGEAPNDTWGFGKLRVEGALSLLPERTDPSDASGPDLRPWESGITPDAGRPEPPHRGAPLVGVEGGGCHCGAARPGGGRRAAAPIQLLASAIWR